MRGSGSNIGGRRRIGGARGWAIGLVAVLALAVVAVAAVRMGDRGGSAAGVASDRHVISRETFPIVIAASGELEAAQQTEIRSELENPADIVEIVDEGARVEKGEVLVQLNDESIRTKIEDQLLSVESARSDLVGAENALAIQMNENDAALRQAVLKVDLAEIDLEKWVKGEVPKKRLELRTNLEKAERDKARLEEKLERSRDLYARSFLSKDELQQDEIRYLEGVAALERAKKDQEVYETYEHVRDQKKKESDVEEARAELERVKRLNESRQASKEADVTNRRRQLTIREERLAKLQEQLDAATQVAPTAGLAVYGTSIGNSRGFVMINGDGPMQIGRTVRPNELMIVLPDTSQMVASVRVHESVAGRIRPGQGATVSVDAIRNESFPGVVKSVSVLAESGGWRDPNLREYTVKIALVGGNPSQRLKPSMRADAEIVLGEVNDALAAPVQSVFREGDVAFVYAAHGGKFEKRPVRVGRRSSTMIELVKGVEPGTTVLLREPTPGEVLSQEISPEAIAAIQPTPEEIKAAAEARRAQQAALAAASEPEIDVDAIRNNPNLPEKVKERLKKMTDDEIRAMAKRFSGAQGGRSGQRGGMSLKIQSSNE